MKKKRTDAKIIADMQQSNAFRLILQRHYASAMKFQVKLGNGTIELWVLNWSDTERQQILSNATEPHKHI